MLHIFALLGLALGLRVLYGLFVYVRHAHHARQKGCGSIPFYPGDILGINTLKEVLRADKEKQIPWVSTQRMQVLQKRENRPITTFRFRQVMQDTIFTSEPKNIQALLATQFKDFELGQKRRETLHSLLGNGIFTADGEYWSRSRALLRPQFTRDQISDLDLEERHVQSAFQAMPSNPTTGWTDAIDMQAIFFRLTIDSATEFLFGESVESQAAANSGGKIAEDQFPYYFDRGQWYAAQRARFEKFYFLANTKESHEIDSFVHAYVDRFVQAALTAKSNPNAKQDEEKQQYVFLHGLAAVTQDPVELRSQLLNILLAGRDTTASLLSWAVLLLARNKPVLTKLRAAILEDFGATPERISFSALKNCRYLQSFMNEVLRLYPIVPGNRRTAVRDTTIPRGGGPDGSLPVYVKKGQSVMYSVFAMQRRKDLWGEDADVFDPDRWEKGRRAGWEYLPFNGGPRICIGQQFALTEAGYVLVRLLQRFDEIVDVFPEREIRYAVNLTMAPGDNATVRMHAA